MAEWNRALVFSPWLVGCATAALLLPAGVGWADPSPDSPKRGFGGSTPTVSNALNVNWYYDWGPSANTGQRGEFVPMAWSGGAITNPSNYSQLVNNNTSTYVLGFNEPERTDQANMTVSQAIALWPQLMQLKNPDGSPRKLVSPAVSDTAAGRAWMSSFISEINRLNYRLDAIAFHWYGDVRPTNAASNFISSVQYYHNTYTVGGQTLPVWITEFGGVDFTNGVNPVTPAMNSTFLAAALPTLDSLSYVQRYSWWNWNSATSLGDGTPFTPSSLGDLYNGRSYFEGTTLNLDGHEGDDTFYLHGGTLQNNTGVPCSLRFIDAIDGFSEVQGSTDWTVQNGWVRVRSGATLRKYGTNAVSFDGIPVTNDGQLFVKAGTLALMNGATVTGAGLMKTEAGSSISLSQTGDTGVTINNDVQLAAGAFNVLNGTHTLNGALIVSNTGSTFNVAGDLTLNGALSGSANLTKTGAGTFRITQPGLHTGVVTISSGTLQVSNADGSATGTGGLTIAKGALLTGDGSIGAPTTVAGTLAPAKIASSASQLHFSAPLTLQSGATVQLHLSVGNSDSLQSTSSVLLNGVLSLSVVGALPDLTPIPLISGNAVSGIFATVNGVTLTGDPSRALAVTYSP
ncbi:MAG: glycosyl hydrolase, partial [Tepidisphaeraceae bacterium]